MIDVTVLGAEKLSTDISKFANQTQDKMNKLVTKLLEKGLEEASSKFSSAVYSGANDVSVITFQEDGSGEIVAKGEAVAFIEFGTGVTNASHPLQEKVQGIVAHGSYGKGKGSNPKGWVYQGEQGNGNAVPVSADKPFTFRTYGEPANRCLYDTALELNKQIIPLAKEIFND